MRSVNIQQFYINFTIYLYHQKFVIFLIFAFSLFLKIPSPTQVFVSGASVIAYKYKDNNGKWATLAIADKGLSYGSLHINHDVSRIYQVTKDTIISFSGDEADFQQNVLDEINVLIQDYQFKLQQVPSTKHIYNYLAALFFKQRGDQKPIMNSLVVQSHNFIGYIDYLGTHFETNYIATSIGKYYVVSLIRDAISQKDLNKQEAIELADQVMTVLRNSDCQQVRRYELCLIEETGIERMERLTKRVQSFETLANYQDLIKII